MEKTSEATTTEASVSIAYGDVQRIAPTSTDISDLKQKSTRGGVAVILSQAIGSMLQLGTLLVLARLLSPADYGLQAMVGSLTSLLSLLKDAGLNFASVNRETLTHEQLSSLFWLNATIGVALTIAVASGSHFLAVFYKDPRLFWITMASSSIFFLNGLTVQHRALLDRSMRFTTSSLIDIVVSFLGTAVAISMAFAGFGYWSLICQNVSLPLFGMFGIWFAMPWLPGRPRWTPELRSMVRVGGTVTLNGIVSYLSYNMEKILLGRFFGPALLGIYGRAYQLANLPVQQLTGAVGIVAFPMLSRLKDDPQRLRRSYLKSHSLVVSLTVPVVISCALYADEIVRVLLGPKWQGTATVLRLLSPTVLVFALLNPFSYIVRALGLVERSLKMAIVIAPVVTIGILAGLRHGPTGVAAGYSVAMLLLWVPMVAWAKHGTGVTTADYWDCIKRPLIAGAAGGIAGWIFKSACQGVLTPSFLLIAELGISFGVYALLLLYAMGQKPMYADLIRQLAHRKVNQ
jgi:PST family polysaccharide transporter